MRSDLLPPGFPPELAAAAFWAGTEVAWPPALAQVAIEWLSGNGCAVLGTELWCLRGDLIQSLPIGSSGMREVHGNTVTRQKREAWDTFVRRSAAETRAYLQSFNQTEIAEKGTPYFNVVWVSEKDFDELGRT